MDRKEIKEFIARKASEGHTMSQIQDLLREDGVQITFMELRLIAAELGENVWKAEEKDERAETSGSPLKGPAAPSAGNGVAGMAGAAAPLPVGDALPERDAFPAGNAAPTSGGTVVELSRIARPGAVASGTVKFGSGASAEWVLDQYGRIALDKSASKPTPQDLQEFQVELQKLLS